MSQVHFNLYLSYLTFYINFFLSSVVGKNFWGILKNFRKFCWFWMFENIKKFQNFHWKEITKDINCVKRYRTCSVYPRSYRTLQNAVPLHRWPRKLWKFLVQMHQHNSCYWRMLTKIVVDTFIQKILMCLRISMIFARYVILHTNKQVFILMH